MTERALLPQFIREAFEAEPAEEPAALGALLSLESGLASERESAAGAPRAPSSSLLDRLELTLSQPPHRYAPFFSQAAQLFELSEEVLIAQLARLRDPNVWMFSGLPGVAK